MTCMRMLILGGVLLAAQGGLLQRAQAQTATQTASAVPKVAAQKPVAPAVATPPVAKYPFGLVEPKVRVVRSQAEIVTGTRVVAQVGDVLLPGQRLTTQAQSGADLKYADGTKVSLMENSDLSLYGVAPPPPAPGKKPKAFKPGTTTLKSGELLITVPSPPPPAQVQAAPVVKKPVAAKPSPSTIIATPVGKVTVAQGSMARVTVEPTGVTRVAVYSGSAQLAPLGKGKPVTLAAGTASRVDSAKSGVAPAKPLPGSPVVKGVQQMLFSTGEAVSVAGSYEAPTGATDISATRVQLADDVGFDRMVSDVRVTGTTGPLVTQQLSPGDHYVRLSALTKDGMEGPMTAPIKIRVARVSLAPGGDGKPATVTVTGKHFVCGLDDGVLSAATVGVPLSLMPAREHVVRCALTAEASRAEEKAEYKLSAAQSGPLISRLEPGAVTYSPTEGQRPLTLVLQDAAGVPVTGARVKAEGRGGVQLGDVVETTTPGSYTTTARWPLTSLVGHSVHYSANDVDAFDGRLPDVMAPDATAVNKGGDAEGSATDDGKSKKRFQLELGAFPLTMIDTQSLVFAIGGGLEIGGRVRLPYGALAFALRPQYEYFGSNPARTHVVAVGVPITYRMRKDIDAPLVPYVGILPQFIADNSALTRDGVQLGDAAWRTGFGVGALLGNEFRFKHGAVFLEGGYRHVLLRSAPVEIPSLSGIFVNLGYRATF